MALNFHIRTKFTAEGVKKTQRGVKSLTTETGHAERAMRLLRIALIAAGAGTIVRQFIQMSDQFRLMQNRIKIVTNNTRELNAVTRELVRVSQATFASLQQTSELYNQIALNTRELGLTQNEVIRLTELLNKGIATSGSEARQASGAVLLFTKALAQGGFRTEEAITVMARLPTVTNAIAEAMGVTQTQFLQLAREGKVTTEEIVSGLLEQGDAIDKEFAQITPTIGQALTNLRTGMTAFIGNMNEATGVSGTMARAINLLAKNAGILVTLIGAVASAISVLLVQIAIKAAILAFVTFNASVMTSVNTMRLFLVGVAGSRAALTAGLAPALVRATLATRAFTVAIATNPIGLIAVAISVAAVAALHFTGALKALTSAIGGFFSTAEAVDISSVVPGGDPELVNRSIAFFIETSKRMTEQRDLLESQLGVREAEAGVLDEIAKLNKEIDDSGLRVSDNLRRELADQIRVNTQLRSRVRLLREITEATENNRVAAQIAGTGIEARESELIARRLAEARAGRVDGESLDENILRAIFAEAASMRAAAAAEANVIFDDEIRQIQDSIDLLNMRPEIRRREGEIQRVVNQQALLGNELSKDQIKLLREHLAEVEQLNAAEGMSRRIEQLQWENVLIEQQIAGNREITEDIELRLLLGDQYNQISAEQLEMLREERKIQRELLDDQRLRTELFGNTDQLQDEIAAFERAKAAGMFDGRQGTAAQMEAQFRIQGRQGRDANDELAGFENGIDRLIIKVNDGAAQMEAALTNAFSAAEDELVNFVKTGEFNFRALVDSILEDLTRLIARQLIAAALSAAIGGGGAGAGAAAINAAGGVDGARADGGPVRRNRRYLVGEEGPEIFEAPASGRIIPNGAPAAPAPAAQQTTNIQVVNVMDPDMVSAAMNDPSNDQTIVNAIGRNRAAINRTLGKS